LAKGKLYIIPVPISENTLDMVIPAYNLELVNGLRIFVVEELKTARRFLRKMNSAFPIDDSVFFVQDKHDDYRFHPDVMGHLEKGDSVGLMSESGYPGVADPGSKIVDLAHKHGIEVVPLIGPSSLFLALAASGLNGQGFTFHGYLPKSNDERIKKIKDIAADVQRSGFAHLFIETPYRNEVMMADLLQTCPAGIKLTVAYDVTGVDQKIITRTVNDWKKLPFTFGKLPCVFILGAG
jgi:16S rRNA (cytidine1402-2'-O)-methyltransferase